MTMKRPAAVAVASIVLIAIAVIAMATVRKKRAQAANLQAAAQAPLNTTRSFVKDIVQGRFKQAGARTTDHAAREVEQTLQDLRAAPLASEQYMPIYRQVNNGQTRWRVDARFDLINGKSLYGQFSLIMQPDGSAKIDLWNVEDWPKRDFRLGDAIAFPSDADVEWAPGARDISHDKPRR
jgi:hypothetical protein